MTNATWLAGALRAMGVTVVEHDGWESRGLGPLGDLKGVLAHHTAGPPASRKQAPNASLATILGGRKAGPPGSGVTALAGPLSQIYLAREGIAHLLAAGRCNHAGAGSWQGVTAGNSQFIGIEAENAGDGVDPWPEAQMDAYARCCAAILKHLGQGAIMAAGHKEFALPHGRKVDPSFDMVAFRRRVQYYLGEPAPAPAPIPTAKASDFMLKFGSRGESVKALQRLLVVGVDGDFGQETEAAVRAFQRGHGLTVDGMVGPKTWAALGVK